MLTVIHRNDARNTGDMLSNPARWLDWDHRVLDIGKITKKQIEGLSGNVILGGGALFGNFGNWRENVKAILTPTEGKKVVVWAAGGAQDNYLPEELKEWPLVGIRDEGTPYEQLPCASCLWPFLEEELEPSISKVVVESQSAKLDLQFPTMRNSAPGPRLINHILSGETLITNSYHGSYWAGLMGRNVEVIPRHGQEYKFSSMPNLTLSECRDMTNRFAERVKTYFN